MGHTLSKDGVKPDDSKIKAVQEFQRTTTPDEVGSLLGLINFCASIFRISPQSPSHYENSQKKILNGTGVQ
jgi:hypothetical protein